jgi:amino-acid N-acetyltransferase
MQVRKARLQDASGVYDLVNSLSGDGTLLKRHFAEICENIRDFTVAVSDGGAFLGCGALHFYGPHLCEVRSIVMKPEAKGQGAGGAVLKSLIDEAEEHGIHSICLFTRIPDFFFKYGFRTVDDKVELPDKIFKDCQNCQRLHRCDEVAMVRGRIPRVSILGPRDEAEQLVHFGS